MSAQVPGDINTPNKTPSEDDANIIAIEKKNVNG